MKIRIYYEDCDVGGVVYHSRYLNFCERARSELFFRQKRLPIFEDYHFVVKDLEATFKKPAFFGDLLEVKTTLLEQKAASLLLKQDIFREKELIFSMNISLVCLKKDRPAKIPPYFLEIFVEVQN